MTALTPMTDQQSWQSRPRDDERPTRKPLALWDRLKFVLLIVGLFWFFVWAEMADDPIVPFSEALRITARSKWWLYVLGGIEVVRQIHYLVSEHWAGYHRFWQRRLFGGLDRRVGRIRDWNRYRVARALKVLVTLTVVAIVLGRLFNVSPWIAFFELPKRAYVALPFIFQLAFAFFFIIFQFVGLFWFLSRGGVDVYFPDDIKTRFTDVWGQDAVLNRVRENIIFLERPEVIEERGGYVPGGILLYGPPGSGKTLMAEAVAGETGRPFVFVEPGAFINMFFGIGVLKVKTLFRKLRKLALRYGGVVVFFDEADALGNRGLPVGDGVPTAASSGWPEWLHSCNGLTYASEASRALVRESALGPIPGPADRRARFVMGAGMGGGGGAGTLQALLTELSGLKKPRGFLNRYVRRMLGMRPKPPPKYRILVMMATNMPSALDPALLRPGRIDRIYKVGYPSKEGRKRTYEGYLAKVRHALTDNDIEKLAVISRYATGASIKDVVNEALVIAIRKGRDAITWADMVEARHHKEHGLPDDVEYIDRERHAVAIHEACHAVAFYRLDRGGAIDIATIERRGDVGGFVSPVPLEDQFFSWKSAREADIKVFLASLAGERLFFDGDSSAGVGGDLRSATRIALEMEGFAAMGATIASHGVTKAPYTSALQGNVETGADRAWLQTDFGQRVEARLQELLVEIGELLVADRRHVLAVAHALERHRTISGDDVRAIIEGTRGALIDGRVYHEPGFPEQLEEYHALALVAHKEVGKPAIPLPAPAPPEPEPLPVPADRDTAGDRGPASP